MIGFCMIDKTTASKKIITTAWGLENILIEIRKIEGGPASANPIHVAPASNTNLVRLNDVVEEPVAGGDLHSGVDALLALEVLNDEAVVRFGNLKERQNLFKKLKEEFLSTSHSIKRYLNHFQRPNLMLLLHNSHVTAHNISN